MTYILNRMSDSGQETFGTLLSSDGTHLCVTIERPWKDNAQDVSCVPLGTYDFYRFLSPKNGDVWRTDEVPSRTAIEIHSANFASQLEGCIAVGNAIGEIDGVPAVLNSKMTLTKLHGILPDNFTLIINGVPE
jgi:hypothetical protein